MENTTKAKFVKPNQPIPQSTKCKESMINISDYMRLHQKHDLNTSIDKKNKYKELVPAIKF